MIEMDASFNCFTFDPQYEGLIEYFLAECDAFYEEFKEKADKTNL